MNMHRLFIKKDRLCTKRRIASGLLCAVLILSIFFPFFPGILAGAEGEYPIYREKNLKKKMIALTFDDGPHPVHTPEILDILKEYGVHATFFVIGQNAEYYPELIRRELAEGHEIGNHTYSHPHVSKITTDQLLNEILDTEDVLLSVCGYQPRLFRPPEGCYSEVIGNLLVRMDYVPVIWSVDTLDWKRPAASAIENRILGHVKSGDIILCHDYVTKSNTPAALRKVIPALLEEGYEFVTVSELMDAAQDIELPSQ